MDQPSRGGEPIVLGSSGVSTQGIWQPAPAVTQVPRAEYVEGARGVIPANSARAASGIKDWLAVTAVTHPGSVMDLRSAKWHGACIPYR
jgi:hypothetical protein